MRVKERGWYTRKGILIGHQISAGTRAVNEENIRFEKHHFITTGLAYRATHWWQRHFGFFFQMAVVGGVSIHTYRTVVWNGEMPPCHIVVRNGFEFADSLFAGLQFHAGIAF